jgi:hypothetical protein
MTDDPTQQHPSVNALSETAAGVLLEVFSNLLEGRHPGLRRWSQSLCDDLLEHLVSVAVGVSVTFADKQPCPLSALDPAELAGLHPVVVAAAEEATDNTVRAWCTELGRLILDQLETLQPRVNEAVHTYEQAVVDARAMVIAAEELAAERAAKPPPDLSGIPPWSQVSKKP